MTDGDYATAWQEYESAVIGLGFGAEGETFRPAGERDPDEAADQALAASGRMHDVLVAQLDTDDREQRELASAKLQAAAAVDIDAANRLLRLADASEAAFGPLDAGAAELSEPELAQLSEVLATPPTAGLAAAGSAGESGSPFAGPAEAADVTSSANDAIDKILADASGTAATVFGQVVSLPGDAMAQAAGKAVDAIFQTIGQNASGLIKKAVKLLLKGIEKALAVFGSNSDAARKKVADWAKDVDTDHVSAWLGRLYHVDDVKARIAKIVEDSANASDEQRKSAADSAAKLASKLGKQMRVISLLSKALGYAKAWLMTLQPYGPLGVATGCAAAVGYSVYAGWDYLDAGGAEWLNLVAGVPAVVDEALRT
jgi:hypothetical protein